MKLTPGQQELVAAAAAARQRAYAPYSRFAVGAALRLRDGSFATGVNVENASYGLTVCAERNAIAAAVLKGMGPGDVIEIAVAADVPKSIPPCGACRQVLAEFSTSTARVLMHRLSDGKTEISTMAELLPKSFGVAELPKKI
jgi:homotetrameric cytidine deaminase